MNQPLCPGLAVVGLLLALGGPVFAQTAAPREPAAREADKTRTDAEAAAMDRARRLAANPMRIILEASRVRRRAEGEVAPTAQLVPVAAQTGPAVSAGPSSGQTAAATTVAAPASPAAEPVTRSIANPREPAAPVEVLVAVTSPELTQARNAVAPAPALDASALPKPVAAPALPVAPLAVLQPELQRPTLVSRVDPELPHRLLADLAPNTVVAAELTIRPDGSVAQVSLANPAQRNLARYVVSALQQWRFAPLPGERQWRVELLFRSDE